MRLRVNASGLMSVRVRVFHDRGLFVCVGVSACVRVSCVRVSLSLSNSLTTALGRLFATKTQSRIQSRSATLRFSASRRRQWLFPAPHALAIGVASIADVASNRGFMCTGDGTHRRRRVSAITHAGDCTCRQRVCIGITPFAITLATTKRGMKEMKEMTLGFFFGSEEYDEMGNDDENS